MIDNAVYVQPLNPTGYWGSNNQLYQEDASHLDVMGELFTPSSIQAVYVGPAGNATLPVTNVYVQCYSTGEVATELMKITAYHRLCSQELIKIGTSSYQVFRVKLDAAWRNFLAPYVQFPPDGYWDYYANVYFTVYVNTITGAYSYSNMHLDITVNHPCTLSQNTSVSTSIPPVYIIPHLPQLLCIRNLALEKVYYKDPMTQEQKLGFDPGATRLNLDTYFCSAVRTSKRMAVPFTMTWYRSPLAGQTWTSSTIIVRGDCITGFNIDALFYDGSTGAEVPYTIARLQEAFISHMGYNVSTAVGRVGTPYGNWMTAGQYVVGLQSPVGKFKPLHQDPNNQFQSFIGFAESGYALCLNPRWPTAYRHGSWDGVLNLDYRVTDYMSDTASFCEQYVSKTASSTLNDVMFHGTNRTEWMKVGGNWQCISDPAYSISWSDGDSKWYINHDAGVELWVNLDTGERSPNIQVVRKTSYSLKGYNPAIFGDRVWSICYKGCWLNFTEKTETGEVLFITWSNGTEQLGRIWNVPHNCSSYAVETNDKGQRIVRLTLKGWTYYAVHSGEDGGPNGTDMHPQESTCPFAYYVNHWASYKLDTYGDAKGKQISTGYFMPQNWYALTQGAENIRTLTYEGETAYLFETGAEVWTFKTPTEFAIQSETIGAANQHQLFRVVDGITRVWKKAEAGITGTYTCAGMPDVTIS